MTKYPKTVCVVFNEFAQAMDARNNKKDAAFYQKRNMGHVLKRYHLHPGNEVKKVRGELARALNILSMQGHIIGSTPNYIAERLRKGGLKIQWNEKKGKFV